MKIIISGGGTGGHVFPAIAVAQKLKEIVPNAEILFVGAQGKIEMRKVPEAGFDIEGLWISGLQRKLTMRNLSFPFKLISSLWRANKIVRSFRPDVVAGFGGYASGPLVEMAIRRGIPSLIQEQNSFPGITNRWLGRKANLICVAYDHLDRFFPAAKIRLTGNPVRTDILQSGNKKEEALRHFTLDRNKKTLLVLGGSLGARSMNEAIHANESFFMDHPDVQLIWQVGKLYEQDYKDKSITHLPNVHMMPFISRMDLAYAVADLVMARAGALTISELCLAQKAAVLVPSPNVAEDHQTKNAESLTSAGAAMMIKDSLLKEKWSDRASVIFDDDQLMALSMQIGKFAKPNATEEIVDQLIALVNK